MMSALKQPAFLLLSAMVLIVGCSTSLRNPQIDYSIQQVYPALVRIHVVMTSPSGGRITKAEGAGSGAIISPEGYVITNHHVAGRSARLVVRMADRQEIDATLIGTDPMTDIAVLKLKLDQRRDPKAPVPVASFGNSDEVRVGDTVLAMGSPAGLSQSVTVGVVSNTEMILPGGGLQMEGEPVGNLVRWIGHDAYIFHGNSGGPLVNVRGQIIGINEMGVAGLGGAIPGNLARAIAREIIAHGKVSRSFAGLECQPLLKGSPLNSGVLVSGVVPDSPAAKAGLKSGDILTAIDNNKVHASVPEELPLLNQLIMAQPSGKILKVAMLRGGKAMTVNMTLAPREPARNEGQEFKDWGMTASNLTLYMALEMQRSREGVQVQTVRPGGQCSEARPAIVPGDVIVQVAGKPVKNAADLVRVTSELTKDGQVRQESLVAYERGTKQLLTVVKVGKEPQEDKPLQARKAYINVSTQVLTKDLAKALKLEGKTGVRVTQVSDGSQAKVAGIKVGDVFLRFEGMDIPASQVEDEEVFTNMVRRRRIGTVANLDIVRDGKALTLKVKLEARPKPASELKQYEDDDFEFAVRELADSDRQDRKLDAAVQGVLVERTESGGWAALAGLYVGDILMAVDGKAVNDLDTLKSLLKEAKQAKARRLVLLVKRGIHTTYLELEPDWNKK